MIPSDDARLERPEELSSELYNELPQDSVTLLGGVFKGYGAWDGPEQRAFAKGGFLEELAKFKHGLNELPTRDGRRMRWVMAVAYHLPRGVAAKLVDAVERTEKKTLRTPDVWLNDYATHFVWPPPFVDQGGPSQCLTPASSHGSDFYCDRRMLRVLVR